MRSGPGICPVPLGWSGPHTVPFSSVQPQVQPGGWARLPRSKPEAVLGLTKDIVHPDKSRGCTLGVRHRPWQEGYKMVVSKLYQKVSKTVQKTLKTARFGRGRVRCPGTCAAVPVSCRKLGWGPMPATAPCVAASRRQ